jgi:hypothetical protein
MAYIKARDIANIRLVHINLLYTGNFIQNTENAGKPVGANETINNCTKSNS